MIAVAIVGILAAIAIPLFSKYVSRSRTAEAETIMDRMKEGALSYYTSDQTYSTSNGPEPWHEAEPGKGKAPGMAVADRVFPGGSRAYVRTHDTIPHGGSKVSPDYESREDAEDLAIFDAMNFNLTDPTYFVYQYEAYGDAIDINACHDFEFTGGTISGYDCKSTDKAQRFVLECNADSGSPECGAIFVVNEME